MKRFIITGAGGGKDVDYPRWSLSASVWSKRRPPTLSPLRKRTEDPNPWTHPSFIDAVADLQRDRQIRASYQPDEIQFHDPCVVYTAALAVYLGHPVPDVLACELERLRTEKIFQTRVFFVCNLGFVTPSAARRISFEDTVRSKKIHEDTYQSLGFDLIQVEPAGVGERVRMILEAANAHHPIPAGKPIQTP